MTKDEVLAKLVFDVELRGLSKNTQNEYYPRVKMQLYIRNVKGSKDRYAILSQANLDILRTYWQAYRPKEWLFYSRNNTGTHITTKAVQNLLTLTRKAY